MKTTAICPLCDSRDSKPLYRVCGQECQKCSCCGLEYLWPVPSSATLMGIYNSEYYDVWHENAEGKLIEEMKEATFLQYMKTIKSFKKNGNLLDVGCAFGTLLRVAQKEGFEPYGIDLNQTAVQRARKFSKNVKCGTLENAKYEDSYFDIVVMSDVIEHLHDLHVTIKEINRILKKNGILYIVTPNTNSLSRKILRSKWPHYKTEHLCYFNQSNIRKLLDGFSLQSAFPVSKSVNLSYISNVLKKYTNDPFIHFFAVQCQLFSKYVWNFQLKSFLGEMGIIAQKQ